MRFDESLREVPVDINALNSAIQQAQSQLQHVEADEQQAKSTVGLLGYLGNACRVAGRAEESMGYLERAVSICRNAGDTTGEFVNTIRFAEATKYGGDFETAERLLREALTQTNIAELSDYQDFVLQHLGKCLVKQGKGNEAIGFLEEALRLRQGKQERALIESTQMALAAARSMSHPNRDTARRDTMELWNIRPYHGADSSVLHEIDRLTWSPNNSPPRSFRRSR